MNHGGHSVSSDLLASPRSASSEERNVVELRYNGVKRRKGREGEKGAENGSDREGR